MKFAAPCVKPHLVFAEVMAMFIVHVGTLAGENVSITNSWLTV